MTGQVLSLLQMAKAPSHPSRYADAALVIIDAQREYSEGSLPLPNVAAATAEIAKLLGIARAQGVPVFHVVHHAPAGRGLFDESGPLVEILPQLKPADGETIIIKRLPNSFAGTDLAGKLKATGRREIVICGFMTHMCVSATARAALDLGFRNTVVAAATGTRALPDPLGGEPLSAEAVGRAALVELADRFSIVIRDSAAWQAGQG